jgi:peptide/nickel transport system permease protein
MMAVAAPAPPTSTPATEASAFASAGGEPTAAVQPPVLSRARLRALVRRPTFVISATLLGFWILAAVLWHVVGLNPYADTGKLLAAPSWSEPFGTDELGRSVFARTLAGADRALLIGPLGSILATLIGSTLGVMAGYFRGWVDTVLTRIFDVLVVLPPIIFLIVLVTGFGASTTALILSIGVVYAPGIARIIRAAVLAEMGKGYVVSAKLQRESRIRIMALELVPNVWPTILIQVTLSLASAILMTATLSFLGLGAQPPSPDWGLQINSNMIYIEQQWWTVLFPALAVASLVVSVQLIADNIKEASQP